jgi:hypothetical protein
MSDLGKVGAHGSLTYGDGYPAPWCFQVQRAWVALDEQLVSRAPVPRIREAHLIDDDTKSADASRCIPLQC